MQLARFDDGRRGSFEQNYMQQQISRQPGTVVPLDGAVVGGIARWADVFP